MRIIDQLRGGRWMWLMPGGAIAAATAFSACSSNFTSCDADKTCGPFDGSAGTAGSAGNAGHGGPGGSAGQGGTSGQGGSGSGAAGASGMAGEAGAAGAGGEPCDTTKTPTTESCLVGDAYGVFVAPTGDDDNAGSMLEPVKTISKAIQLAQADGKFVVACDGTYDEQLNLTTGATLYGGFACPDAAAPWSYEAGKTAKVAPSTRGIALSIAANASAVVIEDFEFDAKDGTDPGESSVAAFVDASTSVALTRVKLVAGKGVDGTNGAVTAVTFPLQSMLNGNPASGDTGGPFNLVMCPAGGSTKGGKGGDGGLGVTGGSPGTPALTGGSPGTVGAVCAGPGSGSDGGDAAAQPPASGAPNAGTISSTGWSSAAGSDGMPGAPGQGGGGGTGADTGGGGGGGGAGGCGGAGATGGKAGGSSIALVVMASTISLVSCELLASDAGKGGAGTAGQNGQTPGGNAGAFAGGGCGGGKGGKGGAGGASGGGAGGISVGIAWSGSSAMDPTPTLMMMTKITTGAAGAKGVGGVAGTNDGIDGVEQDVLKVP